MGQFRGAQSLMDFESDAKWLGNDGPRWQDNV
jgi:hypothetical protein